MIIWIAIFGLLCTHVAHGMQQEQAFKPHGQELTLFDAACMHCDSRIQQCLMGGASLQTKDSQGKTIFHHLAQEEIDAHKIIEALLLAPRKNVIKTVQELKVTDMTMYLQMKKWHIRGLVRVLMMQDASGKIPREYTKKGEPWRQYFKPDYDHLDSHFGSDIMLAYINECA